MNADFQTMIGSSLTLLILIALSVVVCFILKKFREHKVTIKGVLGNNAVTNQIVDDVYTMLVEIVTDITMSISKHYMDDGLITDEELEIIKSEAVESVMKRLNETQNKAIAAIYGDISKWIIEQVDIEVSKIAKGE